MGRPAKHTDAVSIPHQFKSIEIEVSLLTALRREAAARDMSANRLVREILDVVVADRLFAAVLD